MSPLAPAQVWHERLRRALDREGFSKAQRDWAHDLLVLASYSPSFVRFSDDGSSPSYPANPAAGDAEATELAIAKLMDEMGVHLGIGPCPR